MASPRSKTSTPLKTRSLRDLLNEPFPPRQPLLDPLFRQGESVMVWAQTGVGKTWLTLTMALAVAGGGSFLGWASPTPRKVLLVDGEMALEDLQERLRGLSGAVEGLDPEAAGENLRIMARQDQEADTRFPDLAKAEGQDAVLRAIHEHGAELVLLDNFSVLAEVEDENAAGAMNPVLAFLLRVKQAHAACILVHHSGKTGQSFRGSSKLAATFEVILGLGQPDATGGVHGAAFTTQWDKFRAAPHPTLTPRDVRLETRADGTLQWIAEPAEKDNVRAFLAAVATGEFTTQQDAGKALGWDKTKTSRTVARAIAEGRVTKRVLEETLEAARSGQREELGEDCERPF